MMNITVYKMPKCAACESTKMWLDEHDLVYDEVDITEDTDAMELVKSHGYNQAPVVSINHFEDSWSGYQTGKLEALL